MRGFPVELGQLEKGLEMPGNVKIGGCFHFGALFLSVLLIAGRLLIPGFRSAQRDPAGS